MNKSELCPLRIYLLLLVMLSLTPGCSRSPRFVVQAEWPSPMADLLSNYPEISKSIEIYQHDAFVDSKFAWKISGQFDEVDNLIHDLKLKPATTGHIKFIELQRSIPGTWRLPKSANLQVFASAGYGPKHQEGADLLLLVRDPDKHETIVLYEWIF